MPLRFVVICLCAVLVASAVQAAEETVLEVSALGHVGIHFADGVKAELIPIVQGLRWAYSDYKDATAVKGQGLDMTKDGLTVSIPVRGQGGKSVQLLAKLSLDPADANAVRFSYRFTAPEATPINSAVVAFNLPIKPYSGRSVKATGGPETPPVMPEEPLAGGHLLNATAQGMQVGGDGVHGLRIELDQPIWSIIDDQRRWTGDNHYSVQLCALVSADGTNLAAGQSVEAAGTIRFDRPVRFAEDANFGVPARELVTRGFTVDISDLTSPRLLDGNGEEAVCFKTWILGQGRNMLEEPVTKGAPAENDAARFPLVTKLWTDQTRATALSVVGQVVAKAAQLKAYERLTATAAFQTHMLVRQVFLSVPHFEGCTAVFQSPKAQELSLGPGPDAAATISIPDATGLRIERDGKTILTLTSDRPRRWQAWLGGGREYAFTEYIIERPAGSASVDVAANAVFEHSLDCQWGGK